ncbi:MAG: hypothetical protein ACC634_08375, partial [Hyphomicrobiales bacterium]
MQNLQRKGLVNIRHGERPRVAEPSMDLMVEQMAQSMRHLLTHSKTSMEHLKEARTTFETQMAVIAATKRDDGRALTGGGIDKGGGGLTSAAEIYDPVTQRFTQVGPLAQPLV